MALVRKNQTTNQETVAAPVQETVAAPAAAPVQETVAAPAPAPAVVNQQAGTAIVPNLSTVMSHVLFADRQDAFVADYGTLPRLKASNGSFLDADNVIVGSKLKFQVLSWNSRWTVTPNVDGAPDTLVRFSLDNKILDDGSGVTVAQHLEDLRKAGYGNAVSKEYYEVIINLIETNLPNCPHIGGMCQLQLSPTSRKEFNAHCLQTTFKLANGFITQEQAETVTAEAKVVTGSKNKKTWTKFIFGYGA